jgi:hypothetical protein
MQLATQCVTHAYFGATALFELLRRWAGGEDGVTPRVGDYVIESCARDDTSMRRIGIILSTVGFPPLVGGTGELNQAHTLQITAPPGEDEKVAGKQQEARFLMLIKLLPPELVPNPEFFNPAATAGESFFGWVRRSNDDMGSDNSAALNFLLILLQLSTCQCMLLTVDCFRLFMGTVLGVGGDTNPKPNPYSNFSVKPYSIWSLQHAAFQKRIGIGGLFLMLSLSLQMSGRPPNTPRLLGEPQRIEQCRMLLWEQVAEYLTHIQSTFCKQRSDAESTLHEELADGKVSLTHLPYFPTNFVVEPVVERTGVVCEPPNKNCRHVGGRRDVALLVPVSDADKLYLCSWLPVQNNALSVPDAQFLRHALLAREYINAFVSFALDDYGKDHLSVNIPINTWRTIRDSRDMECECVLHVLGEPLLRIVLIKSFLTMSQSLQLIQPVSDLMKRLDWVDPRSAFTTSFKGSESGRNFISNSASSEWYGGWLEEITRSVLGKGVNVDFAFTDLKRIKLSGNVRGVAGKAKKEKMGEERMGEERMGEEKMGGSGREEAGGKHETKERSEEGKREGKDKRGVESRKGAEGWGKVRTALTLSPDKGKLTPLPRVTQLFQAQYNQDALGRVQFLRSLPQ